MAFLLEELTNNTAWRYFRTEYFRLVVPLTTEWYPVDETVERSPEREGIDCLAFSKITPKGYQERLEYHSHIDVPPGIMDCGGSLDTSGERDNPRAGGRSKNLPKWVSDFSDPPNTLFPRDSISVRLILEQLFSVTPRMTESGPVVDVSQIGFLKAWYTTYNVWRRLNDFVIKIMGYMESIPVEPLWPEGQNPIVDQRFRQTRIFRREVIGYEKYFNEKFGGALLSTTDLIADPEWVEEAVRMYAHRWNNAPDPFVLYRVMVMAVARGVLSLMMDMFADISVKANNMAMRYVDDATRSTDPQNKLENTAKWAIPDHRRFNKEEVLRSWPEWTNGVYEITAWPVPEEELADAVRRILVEKYIEERINADNPFPWRGSIRYFTEEISESEVYLY
ncbi:hypothetical protein H072_6926 [Dactylellina haptotyla CBS 200.50]|uniref:Uncharacterized protein n=1 Tax=Dactylellina haptotyla (strain CBS 200.50) TaxID=1284197 RepID=S8AE18_DACHA|nr:hypothetical protein H072_6926 [Dactylellina haptotyla CBS 200.50]